MIGFTQSFHCKSRLHCRQCRNDLAWRGRAGAPEACPYGMRGHNVTSRGLGDHIARVMAAVGIKPCGGCKERQAKLNDLSEKVWRLVIALVKRIKGLFTNRTRGGGS